MLNSVTVNRSRRANAGALMARMLNEEVNDEFYTSAYGGFAEEEDDNDYESESSGHDSIDTDFADTEDEDGENEWDSSNEAVGDENENKKRRTRRIVTKSYKEPKTKRNERAKLELRQRTKPGQTEDSSSNVATEGRSLRASTVRVHSDTSQSAAAASKRQNGNASSSHLVRRKVILAEMAQRKNLPEVRRLTQEELLAEAKITEEINKRSLARYQRLEIERKKVRVQKTVYQQPMVRTHSFTVPSVADQPEAYAVSVDSERGDIHMRQMLVNRNSRCSRTLVTFTDVASYATMFPSSTEANAKSSSPTVVPPPRKRTRYCPLTGRLAAYLDPLTRTPYADLAAFQALRHLYRLHLETSTPAIDLLRQYRNGDIRIGSDIDNDT